MAVNLEAIDAKIRKLQKLRELLADEETRELMADPEMLEMVRSTTLSGNGKHHSNNTHTSVPGVENLTPEDSANDIEEDANLPAEGSLRRKVLELARQCSGKFDTRYIVGKLGLEGHQFGARDPITAVNQALRNLHRLNLVRLSRAGSGRLPHIYEAVREESNRQ
jgi:hypothetical protein